MDKDTRTALDAAATLVKARVEHLLKEQGLSHAELQRRLDMSEGGYWKMYKRGTLDLRKVAAISVALHVSTDRILCNEGPPVLSVAAEPAEQYQPSAITKRMEHLETEVRKLKERLRARP